jgi:hypothetical protein
MQKKTTDTLTMTCSDKHITSQTDLTTENKEDLKSPSFAFLKISASAHCTHLQSRASQRSTKASQKSAILSNPR